MREVLNILINKCVQDNMVYCFTAGCASTRYVVKEKKICNVKYIDLYLIFVLLQLFCLNLLAESTVLPAAFHSRNNDLWPLNSSYNSFV